MTAVRSTPENARTPDDLFPFVGDNETVLFRKTYEPTGDEPKMFTVLHMGEYSNFGQPRLVWGPDEMDFQNHPRPKYGALSRIPLSAATSVRLEFDGSVGKMSHYYNVGYKVSLVSDELHSFVRLLDQGAFESRPVAVADHETGAIKRFWVLLANRVFDAVDIQKTDVTVSRTEAGKGSGRFTNLVRYDNGFVLKQDIPHEAQFFRDTYHSGLIWRAEAFHAVASAGFYGFFGMSKGRLNVAEEVRLPGPHGHRY